MVEIAWVQVEIVGVYRNGCVFELDDDFNPIAFGASRKVQQRVLVKTQLIENSFQTDVQGHGSDSNLLAGQGWIAPSLSPIRTAKILVFVTKQK
jgi:hypothetical protein